MPRFKTNARSNIRPSNHPLAIELLDERVVLSASPHALVSFDTATGVASEFSVESKPLANEGGAPEHQVDASSEKLPAGYETISRSVFGTDDRVLINDPRTAPYRNHGSLRATVGRGEASVCSGSMISSFHFLTAAHCVRDLGPSGDWFTNIDVSLGRGGDERWFGSANASNVIVPTGWINSGDPAADWAMVTLDRNVGNETGWNGYWWYGSDSNLTGLDVSIAGYPSDLATLLSYDSVVTDTYQVNMHESTGAMLAPTSTQLRYNGSLDTADGMSGAPVIEDKPNVGRVIVGVHAYGDGGSGTNEATRMTQSIAGFLASVSSSETPPLDRPDLVDWDNWFHSSVASISTTSIRPGDPISISAFPRNNGTLASSSFTVSFYASTNTLISAGDHLLGSVNVGTLNPFDWDTATLDLSSFPDSVPEGSYHIGWIIDSGNTQSEFNEFNNKGILDETLTVNKALPDVWTRPVEGYAYFNNQAGGDAVNDTLSVDAFLNHPGDFDGYYFSPEYTGQYVFGGTDINPAINPELAIYHAATGAKIGWGDDFIFGDDPVVIVDLVAWDRYIIAIADHDETQIGDVSISAIAPSQTTAPIQWVDPVTGMGANSFVINANGDQDYVSVVATADATSLTVTMDPVATLDGVLVLWDSAGNEIAHANAGSLGQNETIIANVTAGDTYVVSMFSNRYNTQGAFTLSFDFNSTLAGDFNSDGDFTCVDVDALIAEIVPANHDLTYDMNSDGFVDESDLDAWLLAAGVNEIGSAYVKGDANLDGVVDGVDFIAWSTHKFTSGNGWCGGDFNADGHTDGFDFLIWNSNKSQSPQPIKHPPTTATESEQLVTFRLIPIVTPNQSDSTAVLRIPAAMKDTYSSTDVWRADSVSRHNDAFIDAAFEQLVPSDESLEAWLFLGYSESM